MAADNTRASFEFLSAMPVVYWLSTALRDSGPRILMTRNLRALLVEKTHSCFSVLVPPCFLHMHCSCSLFCTHCLPFATIKTAFSWCNTLYAALDDLLFLIDVCDTEGDSVVFEIRPPEWPHQCVPFERIRFARLTVYFNKSQFSRIGKRAPFRYDCVINMVQTNARRSCRVVSYVFLALVNNRNKHLTGLNVPSGCSCYAKYPICK